MSDAKETFKGIKSEIRNEDICDKLTEDGLYYRAVEETADTLGITEDEVEAALWVK